jgi:NADH:ubiquinone oxidoreductase subunit E
MLPSEHYRPPTSGAILAALHAITARCGYLPEDELRQAAAELGVPLSQMFSAASFYTAFSFTPRGRHTVHVCLGTACYIRGGQKMLEKLQATLGVAPGETTPDRVFTLQTVRCVGSCSMSPVVRVDGETHGRLVPASLGAILARYRNLSAMNLHEEGEKNSWLEKEKV